jgi:acyl-coenzyme A thioesterase PaaI-like protein
MMTSPDSPPAGYLPHDRHSPMTAPWEPIYARRTDSALQLAVQIREPHCNARGLAHGGLITSLADNAMGLSARIVAQAARPADGERHAGFDLVAASAAPEVRDFRRLVHSHPDAVTYHLSHDA